MSDIYDLLKISLTGLQDYSLQAALVIDHHTEKVINKNMSKLKEIEDEILVDESLNVSVQSIDDVIIKVEKYAKINNSSLENWSLRELRILSYYMMKLRGNSNAFSFALKLLDKGWKNLFFNGLTFYLLNTWNGIEPEYREAISKLIQHKLSKYKGNNKRYIMMKNHSNFFEKAGPMRMAKLVSVKQISVIDAPTIIGYKSTAISHSYYSEVILKYVESFNIIDFDDLENILTRHNLDRTRKLLFAYLVEKENESNDSMKRIRLCHFANRMLGDVTIAATWAPFVGASDEDAQRLKSAKDIVNMWFAQQVVETFFEVCVQDNVRKEFWLKYIDYINGFKIVGSSATKRLLESNSKIGGIFQQHFISTNSSKTQTSALVLFMKDKMLVEFSDTGALYVYNQNHQMVKLVTKTPPIISSINDLKIPYMQMLITSDDWYTYYCDEGRMTHQGYWQSRLSGWLENRILSSSAKPTIFRNANDDKLFKAVPLLEEPKTTSVQAKDNKESLKIELIEKAKDNDNSSQVKTRTALNSSSDKITAIDTEEVIYKKSVNYSLCSKIFLDDIKVVADSIGFYVTNIEENKYVLLKKLGNGISPVGNIWIKKFNRKNWCEVVHYTYGLERSMGFLKKNNGELYYKETTNDQSKKLIKLK